MLNLFGNHLKLCALTNCCFNLYSTHNCGICSPSVSFVFCREIPGRIAQKSRWRQYTVIVLVSIDLVANIAVKELIKPGEC